MTQKIHYKSNVLNITNGFTRSNQCKCYGCINTNKIKNVIGIVNIIILFDQKISLQNINR